MIDEQLLKAGAVAGAAAFLAACGTSGSLYRADRVHRRTARRRQADAINFANWTYYIDVDDGVDTATADTSESLRRFKAEYGTTVNYQEVFLDNDEFFGTIKAPLEAGQDTGWDIVTPTTWMAKKIVDLGWAEKFDKSNMPNFVANLADEFTGRAADPGNDYLAPWQSLMTGLGCQHREDNALHEGLRSLGSEVEGEDRAAHRASRHRWPCDARQRRGSGDANPRYL